MLFLWIGVDQCGRCTHVWTGVDRSEPLWIAVDRCELLWTAMDHCGPVWAGVNWCGPLWTGLGHWIWIGVDRCGSLWTRGVDPCGPQWTAVDRCEPVWTDVDRCEPLWTAVDRLLWYLTGLKGKDDWPLYAVIYAVFHYWMELIEASCPMPLAYVPFIWRLAPEPLRYYWAELPSAENSYDHNIQWAKSFPRYRWKRHQRLW